MLFEFETTEGLIQVQAHERRAPKITAWLKDLIRDGKFTGTRFYRSGHTAAGPHHPRFIEGGMIDRIILDELKKRPRSAADAGLPLLDGWEKTSQSGLLCRRGAVWLARDLTGTGAAIADLVIGLEDLPEFDEGGGISPGNEGFPVFGEVTMGIDVVDRIAARPRNRSTYIPMFQGQILEDPVAITDTRIV